MKTSKIITLLLIMLIFSFICEVETRISMHFIHWSNQVELKTNFDFELPLPSAGKFFTITRFLK